MTKLYCDNCGIEIKGDKQERESLMELFTVDPEDLDENIERDTNLCPSCRKEFESVIAPFFKGA
jgi:hypothetical protein